MVRLIFILAALGLAAAATAQPLQSEHFVLARTVLSGGGEPASRHIFDLTSAFAQPTPLGMQAEPAAVLAAGFLLPGAWLSPLSPVRALVIQGDSADVRLYWEAVPARARIASIAGRRWTSCPNRCRYWGLRPTPVLLTRGLCLRRACAIITSSSLQSSVAARGLALRSSVMHGESGDAIKKGAIARASKHDGGR